MQNAVKSKILNEKNYREWLQIFCNTALLRPLAAVPSHTQMVPAAPTQLSAVRSFQTTTVSKDIDSAAKFIGAGAATVGVAGSGTFS